MEKQDWKKVGGHPEEERSAILLESMIEPLIRDNLLEKRLAFKDGLKKRKIQ